MTEKLKSELFFEHFCQKYKISSRESEILKLTINGLSNKDIEEKKKDFMQEFYKEKFLNDINSIKKNYGREYTSLLKSAKEKALENFRRIRDNKHSESFRLAGENQ